LKSFFLRVPLEVGFLSTPFFFSVLPLFQDEDDTPWHVQLTQPITLGQGGPDKFWLGVQVDHQFFMFFLEGDVLMGVDVLNDHQFI